GCSLHQAHQLAHVAAVRLLRDRKLDLLAPHTAAHHVPHCDPHAGKPQAPGQSFEPGGRDAERQERSQRHVARDAGGGVQNGDAHSLRSGGKLTGYALYSHPAPVLNTTTRSPRRISPRALSSSAPASAAPPSGQASIPSDVWRSCAAAWSWASLTASAAPPLSRSARRIRRSPRGATSRTARRSRGPAFSFLRSDTVRAAWTRPPLPSATHARERPPRNPRCVPPPGPGHRRSF